MPGFRRRSPSVARGLSRSFLRQIKTITGGDLARMKGAGPAFRTRLKDLGFEKREAEILIQMTAGAAAQAASGKNSLKMFVEQVESGARQLADWNVPLSRVVDALREYTELMRAEDGSHLESALETSFLHLELAVICQVNAIYNDVLEAEKRVLFELHRAVIDSFDPHTLMRYFVESMAKFFAASAGHLFLLDEAEGLWQLQASTGKAVSREAKAFLPATRALNGRLQRAVESAAERTPPAVLLDPGWNATWAYFWSVPVMVRGAFSGVVQLAFSKLRQMPARHAEVLSVAAERTVATAKRFQLIEDIAAREERIFNLARRMLRLEEIERRRISRELHDDAGQSLVVMRLQMEMLEHSLPPEETDLRERLKEIRDLTEATILNMRRLIGDLSPAVLEQLGLAAGLRQLINRFRGAYPCRLRVHIGKLPEMEHDFEMVVYRLAQECLNNISRHSQAKSVNISVATADKVLRLRVQDDGIGFDVEQCVAKNRCFGLVGMRERVILLGGSCDIRSTPSKGNMAAGRKNPGTEVDIQLPIPGNIPSATPWDVVR